MKKILIISIAMLSIFNFLGCSKTKSTGPTLTGPQAEELLLNEISIDEFQLKLQDSMEALTAFKKGASYFYEAVNHVDASVSEDDDYFTECLGVLRVNFEYVSMNDLENSVNLKISYLFSPYGEEENDRKCLDGSIDHGPFETTYPHDLSENVEEVENFLANAQDNGLVSVSKIQDKEEYALIYKGVDQFGLEVYSFDIIDLTRNISFVKSSGMQEFHKSEDSETSKRKYIQTEKIQDQDDKKSKPTTFKESNKKILETLNLINFK